MRPKVLTMLALLLTCTFTGIAQKSTINDGFYWIYSDGFYLQPSTTENFVTTSRARSTSVADMWYIHSEDEGVYSIKNFDSGYTLVLPKNNATINHITTLIMSDGSRMMLVDSPSEHDYYTENKIEGTSFTNRFIYPFHPILVNDNRLFSISPQNYIHTNELDDGLVMLGVDNYPYTAATRWTIEEALVTEPTIQFDGVSNEQGLISITSNEIYDNISFYYTTNGEEATTNSTPYNGQFLVDNNTSIHAIAVVNGTTSGYILESKNAEVTINFSTTPITVSESSQINSLGMGGSYLLAEGFTINEVIGTSANPFTGTIDGQLHTIATSSRPLVGYANDATIKNVFIRSVAITSGNTEGDAGAICCKAYGASRIYNCGLLGGSVGGSRYVGGLVGLLDGTARVINCYSYANITSGTVKAGIVGYNNYASKYTDIRTMVMNCMFYGDIATGGTIVPIYGGLEISNDYSTNNTFRLNNYNYFLYEAPFSKNNTTANPIITAYNCALAAEERFLVRFEFYRHLLNSTRELAAWYATGSATQSSMLKWVLDKNIAPYPILKEQGKYPSVVNYDPVYTYVDGKLKERDTITVRNHGGQLGTLTVNISKPATPTAGQAWPSNVTIQSSVTVPILDKDTANYNYNYRKIQLPYYNDVGDKNYTENKVVTGWMITSITGGTQGSYTETNYDYPNYNYADRSTYAKDLYSESHRIFSQGGYFNVPEGVTAITIEPYWGKAAYLSDACYDRYGYNTTDNLTQVGGGQRYTNNTNCPLLTGEQKVYTTVGNALNALSGVTNPTVYDYAVVLVGNYHHHTAEGKTGAELSSGDKPFTIMSIDLNEDNEPDYCLIYRSGKNQQICPIRFDFITVPGMAMAHKMAQTSKPSKDRDLGIPGNCCPKGWFEITTTGLIKYGQFEHSDNRKTLSPLIFMGGVIDQFVANNRQNAGTDINYNNKTKYMLFGDNVWFKMLSNGTHMDNGAATPHRPISLIGGEYEKLYLSGYFKPTANACTTAGGDNNAECYIDGGKFGEVAGAGQENISGDVTWLVDHADMESFYGGGIKASDANQITGDITTTIKNSHVKLFCGGPMFGDMADNKTVTTTATNCVFGTYFGAGFGGTSIYRQYVKNEYQLKNYEWNSWVSDSYDKSSGDNYRGKYYSGRGVSCGYEYEFFGGSGGNVARLYIKYASFSLAQCNDVNSTLTGCTIDNNFYGGGSLGAVEGTVLSVLDNCMVKGSVFGAGYSATIPQASVFALGGFNPIPYYNEKTGVYEREGFPASSEFTWYHVGSLSNKEQALDGTNIKTTKDLNVLGTVNTATLTLKGITTVNGSVYGGGDESAVTGNTTVTLEGNADVLGNVFGGGNQGAVGGDSKVIIQN